MSSDAIPEHLRAFIRDQIHSIEQLEILLLLRRARNEQWSAELTARELRITTESAGDRLEDLVSRGLVARSDFVGRFCYAPTTPALDQCVAELDRVYAERRVSVITLIFTKPDPAQTFANAFRIRGPK